MMTSLQTARAVSDMLASILGTILPIPEVRELELGDLMPLERAALGFEDTLIEEQQ